MIDKTSVSHEITEEQMRTFWVVLNSDKKFCQWHEPVRFLIEDTPVEHIAQARQFEREFEAVAWARRLNDITIKRGYYAQQIFAKFIR